jgi:protein SEY1
MNGHFAAVGSNGSATDQQYEHGIQVIDEEKTFKYVPPPRRPPCDMRSQAGDIACTILTVTPFRSMHLNDYLRKCHVAEAGFNYHLISVFGSQSTGKSTLLNHLFGTDFSVMASDERRQTTKGIWMSKNKKEGGAHKMAENILVMDVEGTDGRERGEDQDFERKSALFALATSEVLIVNIWEHQVGLYQGANMGLLKTVFEVNLQLFLKDRQ